MATQISGNMTLLRHLQHNVNTLTNVPLDNMAVKLQKISHNAILSMTRARLGRVAPLDRPRSVYKSNVECSFLCRNDGQTLKVKVNDLHFQYQLSESQDAYLVEIWSF